MSPVLKVSLNGFLDWYNSIKIRNSEHLCYWENLSKYEHTETNVLRTKCFLVGLIVLSISYPVVVGAVDISWHAEVAYFDHHFITDETVPGGEISVDEMLRGQIIHTGSYLDGYVD